MKDSAAATGLAQQIMMHKNEVSCSAMAGEMKDSAATTGLVQQIMMHKNESIKQRIECL